MTLKILRFPNPLLRKKSKPLETITHEDKALLHNMLETMYLSQGVGLAAPQVGILKRMVVIDIGEGPLLLINPVIIEKMGREKGEEGCLCMPGVSVTVKRAKKILYKALDKDARPIEDTAEGLLARAIQHETDHLDGRLIIDYVNPIKRFLLTRQLLKNIPSL